MMVDRRVDKDGREIEKERRENRQTGQGRISEEQDET